MLCVYVYMYIFVDRYMFSSFRIAFSFQSYLTDFHSLAPVFHMSAFHRLLCLVCLQGCCLGGCSGQDDYGALPCAVVLHCLGRGGLCGGTAWAGQLPQFLIPHLDLLRSLGLYMSTFFRLLYVCMCVCACVRVYVCCLCVCGRVG